MEMDIALMLLGFCVGFLVAAALSVTGALPGCLGRVFDWFDGEAKG